MSTLNEELPVYIVSGPNWTCEIKMDIDDANDAPDVQAVEAATKAVEIFKGVVESDSFQLTNHDDSPSLGGSIQVYLKGTDPQKGYYVYTHVALANGGFYKDSFIARSIIDEELAKFNDLVKTSEEEIDNTVEKFVKGLRRKGAKLNPKPKKPKKRKDK